MNIQSICGKDIKIDAYLFKVTMYRLHVHFELKCSLYYSWSHITLLKDILYILVSAKKTITHQSFVRKLTNIRRGFCYFRLYLRGSRRLLEKKQLWLIFLRCSSNFVVIITHIATIKSTHDDRCNGF